MFGWLMSLLGFGGVKVLLWKYTEPLKVSDPTIKGAVLLKTKKPMQVLSVTVKVIEEWTTTEGEGDNKHKDTETTTLGTVTFPALLKDPGIGYPLELKPGEDKEQPFEFQAIVNERMQGKAQGGVLGGIGKLASWGSGETIEYYLVAEASVKGQAFGATAKEKLKIAQ